MSNTGSADSEDAVIARYVRDLGPPPLSTVQRVSALITTFIPQTRDQSPDLIQDFEVVR